MSLQAKSLRTFIGSNQFNVSRAFYRDVGFEESVVSDQLSYFEMEGVGFCLQRYYVEDWVNNSMMFLEVADLDAAYRKIEAMQLPSKYPGVRLQPIQDDDWGREFFLHDPAGVLWHIGTFASDDSS